METSNIKLERPKDLASKLYACTPFYDKDTLKAYWQSPLIITSIRNAYIETIAWNWMPVWSHISEEEAAAFLQHAAAAESGQTAGGKQQNETI